MGEENYTKYWLKAPDEETFRAAFPVESIEGADSPEVRSTEYPQMQIHLVGQLTHETGEVGLDEFGGKYPILILVPGYHVNIKLPKDTPLPKELVQFQIPEPNNKKADWFDV
jgi:hypothetical protein